MNLRFLVLIRGMREGGESKIFLCCPRGSRNSHQFFRKQAGVLSSHGLFVSELANGGWCLLEA